MDRPRSPANKVLSSSPMALPRHSALTTPSRTSSTSSCPATLSLAPVTTLAVAVEVLGELDVRAQVNATEVLSELRDSRPASEILDDNVADEIILSHVDSDVLPDEFIETPTNSISSVPQQLLEAHSIQSTSKPNIKRRQSASRSISPLSPIEPCQPVLSSHKSSTSPRSTSNPFTYPSPAQSSSRSASRSRSTTLSSVADKSKQETVESSTCATRHHRTSSAHSASLAAEQQQIKPIEHASSNIARSDVLDPKPVRPTLYSYTSFEDSFGLEAPRTPEGSPKSKPSSWWSRS
ncbi:hypothetical protein OIV83_005186 [Microbotryomycetes sp. JL201]|nr:hypothetical protein OIV83_005186 [Microbotryomycetes sp. JL201]